MNEVSLNNLSPALVLSMIWDAFDSRDLASMAVHFSDGSVVTFQVEGSGGTPVAYPTQTQARSWWERLRAQQER